MRFEFIERHRSNFQIKRMCHILKVSLSGYYAWRKRPPSTRTQEDARLWKEIEKVHDESHQIYGYRRVHQALIEAEINASRRRVARLMRQYGRRGKQFRRYTVTTKPGKRLPEIPDRLQRTFTADRPNQVWIADITYVRTGQGWLYLAVIIDLYSRRVVGWSMSKRLTEDLTLSALKMALIRRQPGPGLIHHSDRGSQYTSHAYQRLLKLYQVQPSLGRTGSCFDNAAMESYFGSLKSEWLYFHRFDTRQDAMTSIFYYTEIFYNRKRLHSAIGYRTPCAFEAAADKVH